MERRVVLEVNVKDLRLIPIVRQRLCDLAGKKKAV
jgi:hypothetical protein